jgi:hypothetical protein
MKSRIRAQIPSDEETRSRIAQPPRQVRPPAQLQELHRGDGSFTTGADRFLSARAVGAMTADASKRKIRRWVDRGEFNSYALDGKTVYSEREVLAFVERVKAKGPSRAPWRGCGSAITRETPRQGPKTMRPSKSDICGACNASIAAE